MASYYKYCRYCEKRKKKRWGLKSVYYCDQCGHRTCSSHFASGDICLKCAEENAAKKQAASQEKARAQRINSQVNQWCSAYSPESQTRSNSVNELISFLDRRYGLACESFAQQLTELKTTEVSLDEMLTAINDLISMGHNMTLQKIKNRIYQLPESKLRKQLISIVDRPLTDGQPTVVVFGPMNHGKSSLLNALVRRPNHFKVADARETVSVSNYSYNGITYRDIPGWDAAEGADNDTMLKGLDGCDTWLYNHDVGVGEFNVMDLRCLSSFAERVATPQMCERGLIICLSKTDKKSAEELVEIRAAIERQLSTLSINSRVGLPHKAIVEVSANYFEIAQSAPNNSKKHQAFINRSGLNELSQLINTCLESRESNASLLRLKEVQAALSASLSELKKQKKSLKTKVQTLENDFEQMKTSYQTLRRSI